MVTELDHFFWGSTSVGVLASGKSGSLLMQNVLITGATGVLGARLLKELLASTPSKIYCLVRAETPALAKQRLLSFLRVYDPNEILNHEFEARVVPVLGDITHESLGLSPKDYADLAEKIDATLHAAANTNLFSNFRRMEPINVGGAKNIIRFVLKTSQKYLCYVSTYTVMGDKTFDKSLIFTERDLDIGQGFQHMTYQHTKFIAENLVRSATEQGLIWNIMRPGQIFGEASTGWYPQGQTNVSGLFYDIFKTIIETQIALYSGAHYDITPVDYVSRAILFLALKKGSYFETYHLTNPDIKRYFDVVNVVKSLGYDIEIVSQLEYRRMLFEKCLQYRGEEYKSVTTKAFRWWFLREQFDFNESCVTVCDLTQKALSSSGIQCPSIGADLIGTYIEDCIRKKYFSVLPNNGMKNGTTHSPARIEPDRVEQSLGDFI